MTESATSEPVYCHATINHLGPDAPVPIEVAIHDARSTGRELSWQTNGFELRSLPSAVADWSSLAAVEATHYEEVTEWASRLTGCGKVLFYPALLRNPEAGALSDDFAPIELAHSDYTESYADMIRDPTQPYHKVLLPSMRRAGVSADDLARCSRILTLQWWRNVGPARMDYPLCFCDADTVGRRQLAPIRVEQYGGVETQFDAFGLLEPEPGAANRWYTYPAMEPDEVVLFRAFDSERVASGEPFWTPHCAFRDPHSTGVPRSSVEMRSICLFW